MEEWLQDVIGVVISAWPNIGGWLNDQAEVFVWAVPAVAGGLAVWLYGLLGGGFLAWADRFLAGKKEDEDEWL